MLDGENITIGLKRFKMKETIKISIEDVMLLGIKLIDICNQTGLSEYAINEG
jgi:hypothetical protein